MVTAVADLVPKITAKTFPRKGRANVKWVKWKLGIYGIETFKGLTCDVLCVLDTNELIKTVILYNIHIKRTNALNNIGQAMTFIIQVLI